MNNLFRSLRKKAPPANNERRKTTEEKRGKKSQTITSNDPQEHHLLSSSTADTPQHRRGPLHLFHRNESRKTREVALNKKQTAPIPDSTKKRQQSRRKPSSIIVNPSPPEKSCSTAVLKEGEIHQHTPACRRLSSVSTPQPFVPEEADPLVQLALTQKASPISEAARAQISLAVKALDRAGNALFEKGDYDAAFLRYERSLWLKQKTVEDEAPSTKHSEQEKSVMASVATSINNMTYLKQRSGKASTAETMSSYLKSLQIKREILGPDHLSVGKTLNNIGSVFYLNREFDAALTAYRDAFRILKQHLGENHLDVVTVLSNIADVQAAMGDTDAALESYRRALALRWNELGSQDKKVVRLMEQVARLETGEQPQLRLDDETEFGFASQEEMRQEAVFMDDLKELQQELDEDMKYFDLVERQMAIDMLRDRTQMLREMRAIGEQQEEEQTETGTLGQEKLSAIEESTNRTEAHSDEATENSVTIEGITTFELPSLDQYLNDDTLGLSDRSEKQAGSIHQNVQSQYAVVSKEEQALERGDSSNLQRLLCEGVQIGRRHTSPDNPRSFAPVGKELGQSSLCKVGKEGATSLTEELGTTISITSDSDITNASDEDPAQEDEDIIKTMDQEGQQSEKVVFQNRRDNEPKRFSVKPRLTPSQRQTALVSVQSRLEELRAKRGLLPTPKVTIPTDHRAYMDQTASSVAKSNPCRKHSVQGQTIRTNAEAAAAN